MIRLEQELEISQECKDSPGRGHLPDFQAVFLAHCQSLGSLVHDLAGPLSYLPGWIA